MRSTTGYPVVLASALLLVPAAQVRAGSAADTASNTQADRAGTDVSGGSASQLDEVLVTARKRPESILKVPVVETVVPQAKLESLQVTEIADLPKLVPGLDMGQNILTIGTQVAIRGVGTTAYDQGVDQSVALNIDGVTMGTGLTFQSGLFDVGAVEVLKGPQSLFYGKSTTAGVISLRTADPTDAPEIIGRAAYEAESSTYRGDLIFSGPVVEGIRMRLAMQYSAGDGYFRDEAVPLVATGAKQPLYDHGPHTSDNYKVRLTTLWDPTEQISARLKVNLTGMSVTDPSPSELASCSAGIAPVPPITVSFIGPYNDCRIGRNYYTVANSPSAFPGVLNQGYPFLDSKIDYGSLDLTYRPVHNIDITSTTGYYWVAALSSANALETTYAGTPIVAQNDYHRRSLSEEVRASSDFAAPLNFTVGGYYEAGAVSNDVTELGNTKLGLPGLLADGLDTIRIRTYSAFGQLRYRAIAPLELTAGLRWAHEIRAQNPINELTGQLVAGQTPEINSSRFMPEFTATYTPTDDLTLFGAYKKGFKSGSFSVATPANPAINNAFGDESSKGGEIGLKSRWLDHRLQFNAATYLYDYSGLQVGTTEPAISGNLITRTLNAGAARTYGVDMDGAFRPLNLSALQLNGALSWNHARYTSLQSVPCWPGQTISEGCNQLLSAGLFHSQNLSGTQMVRAPEWQLNGGASYELRLTNGYKLTFTNSNAFFSRYPIALASGRPGNDQFQGSFAKVDLAVELAPANSYWSVAIIGKNINDRVVMGNCSFETLRNGFIFPGSTTGGADAGPAGISAPVCFVDPGREVWLKLAFTPLAHRD